MKLIDVTSRLLENASRSAQRKYEKSKELNNVQKKKHWQKVKVYLENAKMRIANASQLPGLSKTVFIAYSERTGGEYCILLKEELEKKGFTVLTGFMKAEKNEGMLVKNVLNHLHQCTVYVALLTRVHAIKGVGEDIKYCPGAWVIFEAGMAIALNKPFVLLVENGIHDDFRKNVVSAYRHLQFNNYYHFKKHIVKQAVEEVGDRYAETAENTLLVSM